MTDLRNLNGWTIALVATLLTGCARFHPQPIAPATAAADFANRSLDDPGLRQFLETNRPGAVVSWPMTEWDFEELSLAALYFHPDLDLARAQLAVAQAGGVTAGQRPNPTAAFTPGYNTTSSGISPWILNFSLDVPIETAGKRGYRIAQAAHLSEAARWTLATTAWQVRSRLRHSLLALHAAHESQRLLEKQLSLQSDSVRNLETQLREGAVPVSEVTQARIALNQTQLSLLDVQNDHATALTQVATAIGLAPEALANVTLNYAAFQELTGELTDATARRQALLNRADILAALAEYAASESALQLEVAKQFPDLHFNPGYELDQTENKWSLGLSVELPVLNQNQGPIAEAEARRTEVAARFNALQARVLGEIAQAQAGYHSALEKMAIAENLRSASERQTATAQAMLDLGEISRFELIQRHLELNTTALLRLQALLQAQEALGKLEDSLQSPATMTESLWLPSPREPAPAPLSALP